MALKSTQDTRTIEKLVRSAAAAKFGRGKAAPVFEHGHWWVTIDEGEDWDGIFDVVDAEPDIGATGLDFERVQ